MRVDHLCLYLVDRGVAHRYIIGGGGNTGSCSLVSGKGIGKVGFGLGNTQLKLCILDNHERIARLHLMVFLESYLADKSRHSGVDRGDMLANRGIVCIFHVAEVEEFVAYDSYASKEHGKYYYVVGYTFCCSFHSVCDIYFSLK